MDSSVTEHRHPEEDEKRRHSHHAEHELANRPTPRDTSDEHAHEGCPGDPPSPVEQRPGAQPVRLLIGELAEREVDQIGQIGADVLQIGAHEKRRRSDNEHEQQQRHRKQHVHL